MTHQRPTITVLLGAILTAAAVHAPLQAADLGKYLPDGTFLVATFNIKQVLDAPLVKGDEKAFRDGIGEFGKLLDGFGVDPAKDLNRIVLAAGEQLQSKNLLVLLEGRFNPAKVQARLEELAIDPKNNLRVSKEGGSTFFQITIPQQTIPNLAIPNQFLITLLDGDFIAVALDKEALIESLAKKAGSRKATNKKEVLELVGKINPKETASVVVVPAPEMLANGPLSGLTTVTGGITVSDGVKTDLKLTAKDADSAKTLATLIEDTINQVKQLLPLIAGQQPGFGPREQAVAKEMMDSVKTTATNSEVNIRSNISKEFIEKNSKKDR